MRKRTFLSLFPYVKLGKHQNATSQGNLALELGSMGLWRVPAFESAAIKRDHGTQTSGLYRHARFLSSLSIHGSKAESVHADGKIRAISAVAVRTAAHHMGHQRHCAHRQ
jgi:hypothetical protein